MASKYFIPHCIRPIFLQSSENDAKNCGTVNGFIYCALVTLIILVGGGRFYLREQNPEYKSLIKKGIIGLLIVIWVVLPIITRYGQGTIWRGYDSVIRDLMSQGYTRKEALAFVSGFKEASTDVGLPKGLAMVFASSEKEKEPKKGEEQTKKGSNNEKSVN